MSDIFLSYASQDLAKARTLAEQLQKQGWTVFWDRTIPAGQTWRQWIGEELREARSVVVLWSESSIVSNWVQEEADDGRERGISIPVLIEDVRPPIGFRAYQAANLVGWDSSSASPAYRQLITDIETILGPSPATIKNRARLEAEAEEKRKTQEEEAKRKAKEEAAREKAEKEARIRAETEAKRKAEEEAARRRAEVFLPGETFKDCAVCPEMVVVPAGSFVMGSPQDEPDRDDDEGPQHGVSIARPFAVGVYEVTFAEWDECVDAGGCNGYLPDDQGWGRGRRPVIYVSWNDARAYVKWLSDKTGKDYRLLTEAEWEYVARAGTTTQYSFGVTITDKDANFNWNVDKTTKVGSYPANPWGLYDMHGNVWEWVADCYDGAAYKTQKNYPTMVGGRQDSCARVLRGGSWRNGPGTLRSASRSWLFPGGRDYCFGFRVARTL